MLTQRIHGLHTLSANLTGSVVTVGVFDGVHRGHQRLLATAKHFAEQLQQPLVVYTFDPHPAEVLAPNTAPKTLTSIDERVHWMQKLCAPDYVNAEPFNENFRSLPADVWIEKHLLSALGLRHIVVGYNFHYGRDGRGDAESLARAGEKNGFGVSVVPPELYTQQPISSTRIRKALSCGALSEAEDMLGHLYALTGRVEHGEGRGRSLGFPTANLRLFHSFVPKGGVYATWAILANGTRVPSVTNIGHRPTFSGSGFSVETHLLAEPANLYGTDLRVELVAYLREEQRFATVELLQQQLKVDVAQAKQLLSQTEESKREESK